MNKGLPYFAFNNELLLLADETYREDGRGSFASPVQLEEVVLDYSGAIISEEAFILLLELANQCNLTELSERLCSAGLENKTELKKVAHPWLRNPSRAPSPERPSIINTLLKMEELSSQLENRQLKGFSGKSIDTAVFIGIGGSYLGPQFVVDALKDFDKKVVNIHFLAGADPCEMYDLLDQIEIDKSVFFVVSKSFSTVETLRNSKVIWSIFEDIGCNKNLISEHFYAVSSNEDAALSFGIKSDHIFKIGDWVGGRFSVWSAVGLPIMLKVGVENFKSFLEGGKAVDQHVCSVDIKGNIPAILAILGVWYRNYLGFSTYAIFPYSYRLRGFPCLLQQIDMESNGKSLDADSLKLSYKTAPIVWGGQGDLGQHAYFQLLHQGTSIVPIDLITISRSPYSFGQNCSFLNNSAKAQAVAFAKGNDRNLVSAYKYVAGGKPVNIIEIEKISPYNIGVLLALYEYKACYQGAIWKCNSFDQWGVELGKNIQKGNC